MEKVYQKYAELTAKIKELEDYKKALNLKIIGDLESRESNQCKVEFGTFSLVERKSWKYSEIVKEKEAELKVVKKEEEEKGVAEQSISKSLRFQGVKN